MTQRNQASRKPIKEEVADERAFRLPLIIVATIVAAAAGFGLYAWQLKTLRPAVDFVGAPAEPEANDKAADEPTATASQITQLVRKRGMPLSPTLLTRPSDDGSFWYVGKPTTESLVEIPFPPGTKPAPPPEMEPVHENPGFLGAQACQSCHMEKYETFVETAHHLTSRPGTQAAVRGSLEAGKNQLRTVNPDLVFTMVERDSRLYQKVRFYDWEFEVPIDLVIGSSKLAQSFLYWDFNALYQMNVTHLTDSDCWINSPGYFDGDAAYARPIPARCIECHSTYADYRGDINRYTPNSLILGISCERCHGPGKSHVEHHVQHPNDKDARFVTVPTDLPRDRQIDVCGQCHSGGSLPKGMPYAFRPGDKVDDHYHPMDKEKLQNSVHASNQATRLALTECFKQSEMACADCHNPHRLERGQMAVFSERCIKCHEPERCGQSASLGESIRENCIDCHMPKEETVNLRLETTEGNVFPPLRDHLIRIDPKATEAFLEAK